MSLGASLPYFLAILTLPYGIQYVFNGIFFTLQAVSLCLCAQASGSLCTEMPLSLAGISEAK